MRPGRVLAALAALVICAGQLVQAAEPDGTVNVIVSDARTSAPLSLVRATLEGPEPRTGFSDSSGDIRFEHVENGSYTLSLARNGYRTVEGVEVLVRTGGTSEARVSLVSDQQPTVIGSVRVLQRAPRDDSTLRGPAQPPLLGSLDADIALLPAVQLNHDGLPSVAGRTAGDSGILFDGVPLDLAGSRLRLNTDLLAGASVSERPSFGRLGGAVSYRTFEPTLNWQTAAFGQMGSVGTAASYLAERGTLNGRLGVSATIGQRSTGQPLDRTPLPTGTSLRRDRAEDRTTILRLRLPLSTDTALSATRLDQYGAFDAPCRVNTSGIPCDFGALPMSTDRLTLTSMSLDSTLFGRPFGARFFALRNRTEDDQTGRSLFGISAPRYELDSSRSAGALLTSDVTRLGNVDVTFDGIMATTRFRSAVGPSPASKVAFDGRTTFGRYRLSGRTHLSHVDRAVASITLHDEQGTASRVSLGGSLEHQGARRDAGMAFALNEAGLGAAEPLVPADPARAAYDCPSRTAIGYRPAMAPPKNANMVSAHYGFLGTQSRLELDAEMGSEHNATVNVIDTLDSSHDAALYSYDLTRFLVGACGHGPATIVALRPLAEAGVGYRRARATYLSQIGPHVIGRAYWAIQGARLNTAGETLPARAEVHPGSQVPDLPLHRAGASVEYRNGEYVRALVNTQFLFAGNPFNVSPTAVVSLGALSRLGPGTAALSVTNVFAREGHTLTQLGGLPYTTFSGLTVPRIVTPLPPRTFRITYSLSTRSRATNLVRQESDEDGALGVELRELPAAAPKEPFHVDADSASCLPELAATARKELAFAAEVARSNSPAGHLDGLLSIDRHGTALELSFPTAGSTSRRPGFKPFFACARLSFATLDAAMARGLFIPSPLTRGSTYILFEPAVGFYMLQAQKVESEPDRASNSDDAFTLASSCPTELRPIAISVLADMRAASSMATPSSRYVAASRHHETTVFTFSDAAIREAIVQCGFVRSLSKQAAGKDASPRPAINFRLESGLFQLE